MKNTTLLTFIAACTLVLTQAVRSEGPLEIPSAVPGIISYQGRVAVGSVNFNGTGHFKFALVDANGFVTYWSNDGSSVAGGAPATAVDIPVANGSYSALLGDGGMQAIPLSAFQHADVRLRVWFDDGSHGSQLLSPDQRLAAVGYAFVAKKAESVSNGAITSSSIAAGAIGTTQLANGAVTSANLASGAVGANQLASGSVDLTKLAPGAAAAIVQAGGGSGGSSGPNTGVALSIDPASASLAAAGYVKIGSQSFSSESWAALNFTGPPATPTVAYPHTVWTGSEMIVFGEGELGDGSNHRKIIAHRFNPATSVWTELPPTIGQLTSASMVWTGTEVIFWGVNTGEIDQVVSANNVDGFIDRLWKGVTDGRAFNVAQNTWRNITSDGQPNPRFGQSAVWTGAEMIVWGGSSLYVLEQRISWGNIIIGGVAYVDTDMKMNPELEGGRYNPTTGRWTAITGGPTGRMYPSAVWTGIEMIVWGGLEWVPFAANGIFGVKGTGAAYNPGTGSWRDLNNTGAPFQRFGHTGVNLGGGDMMVFGGSSPAFFGGGIYHSFTDSWSQLPGGEPAGRYLPSVAVASGDVIAFGGATSATDPSLVPVDQFVGIVPNFVGVHYVFSPPVFSAPANTGARYDLNNSQWVGLPTAGAPSARVAAASVWTGSQMMIFGGNSDTTFDSGLLNANWLSSGGVYDRAGNQWINFPNGTVAPRHGAASVWTGSELLYWGGSNANGQMHSGGRYNPATNYHTDLPQLNAPSSRSGHSAVWSGTEMIVWGGSDSTSGSYIYPAAGARYKLSTNTWAAMGTANQPAPRKDQAAVWTGAEMIVWGGDNGANAGTLLGTGGRYKPADDTWQPIASNNAPVPRNGHTAIWTGSDMVVWGGVGDLGLLGDGARYTLAQDAWTVLPAASAPSPRTAHTSAWTGAEMIVWGGLDFQNGDFASPNTGSRYSPASDTWSPLPTANAPTGRNGHSAVWTGSEMIVWGGNIGLFGGFPNDGARYAPAQNAWITITNAGAPSPRTGHTAFWAGSGMVTFLGQAANGSLPTDAFRYTPPTAVYYYLKLNP